MPTVVWFNRWFESTKVGGSGQYKELKPLNWSSILFLLEKNYINDRLIERGLFLGPKSYNSYLKVCKVANVLMLNSKCISS